MRGGAAREHGPTGRVRHLPGRPPAPRDDCRHPGVHLQGLDQGPGHKWLPGNTDFLACGETLYNDTVLFFNTTPSIVYKKHVDLSTSCVS